MCNLIVLKMNKKRFKFYVSSCVFTFFLWIVAVKASEGSSGGFASDIDSKSKDSKVIDKIDNVEFNDNLVMPNPDWTKKLFNDKYVNNNQSGKVGRRKAKGLFRFVSLSKLLNFFPVGGERECAAASPAAGGAARSGLCLNVYDCHQRGGRAAGDCAHGFGVCCLFTVSCGGVVEHNLTYFLSPGFPELWAEDGDCNVTVRSMHQGVTQIRIDFLHFNIGQPNRTTGACDSDYFTIGAEGPTNFTVCGQNHGQHVYWDLLPGNSTTARMSEEESSRGVQLALRAPARRRTGRLRPARLWLIRIAQLPLVDAAPPSCRQYFTDVNGTFSTMNYAEHGRHLAWQQYRVCVRRAAGVCAVAYRPCDPTSFRIGPSLDPNYAGPTSPIEGGPGAQGGAGTGFLGDMGSFLTGSSTQEPPVQDNMQGDPQADPGTGDGADTMMDEGEGSGERDYPFSWFGRSVEDPADQKFARWSPYAQHYSAERRRGAWRYWGYGNFGLGLFGFGRQRCADRITTPCDNELFIGGGVYGAGVCDPHHCGSSFCPGAAAGDCRVESTRAPYVVTVNFGAPTVKGPAEDNTGACLRWEQLPC